MEKRIPGSGDVERYKVSFIVEGRDLDPTDILDTVEEDIAPNCAALLEAFTIEGSVTVGPEHDDGDRGPNMLGAKVKSVTYRTDREGSGARVLGISDIRLDNGVIIVVGYAR